MDESDILHVNGVEIASIGRGEIDEVGLSDVDAFESLARLQDSNFHIWRLTAVGGVVDSCIEAVERLENAEALGILLAYLYLDGASSFVPEVFLDSTCANGLPRDDFSNLLIARGDDVAYRIDELKCKFIDSIGRNLATTADIDATAGVVVEGHLTGYFDGGTIFDGEHDVVVALIRFHDAIQLNFIGFGILDGDLRYVELEFEF